MTNDLITAQNIPLAGNGYVFDSFKNFENGQHMAKALCQTDIVPKDYRDNLPNCLLALDIAQRMQASPLMVMQNLDIIHGRPSWRSQFVIAMINSSGRFHPLRFHMTSDNEVETFEYEVFESEWIDKKKSTKIIKKKQQIINNKCRAWTIERGVVIPQYVYDYISDNAKNNKSVKLLDACEHFGIPVLKGTEISIKMACLEGWYDKSGSKWKTMEEQMLQYRASSFFVRLHAPEMLMGFPTLEESEDMDLKDVTPKQPKEKGATNEIDNIMATQAAEAEALGFGGEKKAKEVEGDAEGTSGNRPTAIQKKVESLKAEIIAAKSLSDLAALQESQKGALALLKADAIEEIKAAIQDRFKELQKGE